MNNWSYSDLLKLVEIKDKNIDHYLERITELETELERTRKALDFAVDALKEIDELLSSNKFDVREVPLLNITQTKISMLLKCINLEQITALEQKDEK